MPIVAKPFADAIPTLSRSIISSVTSFGSSLALPMVTWRLEEIVSSQLKPIELGYFTIIVDSIYNVICMSGWKAKRGESLSLKYVCVIAR